MVEIINESNFEDKVLEAPGKTLVEFFATWCPHCQRMMPTVDELAESEQGDVRVYRVDVDQSPDLAEVYAPDGFPAFVLFEGGELAGQVVGETTLERLEELIG